MTKDFLSHNTLIAELLNTPYQKPLSRKDIAMIMGDLIVSQSTLSRKAHIEKKEVIISTKNTKYQEILRSVFHASIISQILETFLYGINVFEINWERKGGLLVPSLVGRDFQEFKFNNEGKLVFLGNGGEEEIPPFKVVYGIYNQSFRVPYGESTLRHLYFSVNIKNAGLDFWIRFLEKFGEPWAIAKTDDDPQSLAYEVSNMLNGSTAVIDKEEEIELIQPSAKSDFKDLIQYCDSQITRFILGGNLTGEVKEGSLAAAQAHNEIRSEIALSDERILCYVCNRVISFFKELNGIKEEITFSLFNEDEPKLELANRDKTIYEMGFQPTQEYIEKTYNIKTTALIKEQELSAENYSTTKKGEKDFKPFKNALNTPLIPFKLPLNKNIAFDEIDNWIENLKLKDLDLQSLLENAKSFEEVLSAIEKSLQGEDLEIAEALLAKAIMNAQIYGAING
ncbi:phage portal protein family protein [Helicobacter typhlonius]|uniref:phage portal protein family protein n=1 Tax=Helicobacter typhlonius TaxID=76936 RepID=UPI002FE1D0BE